MAGDCRVWAQATTAAPNTQGPQFTHRIPWNPVEALEEVADPLRSWSVEIHGLLATNYTFNFNEPASGKNGLLLMNRKHNHFDLDLANVRLQRIVANGLGFIIDLDFGKTAEVTGRATR